MEKKIALVTGASAGIGAATAIRLAEDCFVIVNYNKSEAAAKEVLDTITENGGEGALYQCDVSDEDAVKLMFRHIKKEYGTLHILVNNAGIKKDGLFLMMSRKSFDEVMNVNLGGCFNCSQQAVLLMTSSKQGGSIVNIGSISGLSGQEGQANYSASKGAIVSMTKALAKEYAKYNIRVNAVAPGFVKTKMTAQKGKLLRDNYMDLIPLKRFGHPEEIANVVAFLAGEGASYITGECINASGGMIM